MRFISTSKVGTDPFSQLLGSEQAIVLTDVAFAMHPFGLNRIEPGTLRGQQERQDAHTFAGLLDLLVVFSDPAANGLTFVPGGIIPDEDQHLLSLSGYLLTEPLQKVRRYLADRASLDKAQVHATTVSFKHPVTGQSFGIRIIFVLAQLLQMQWLILLAPTVQIGLAHPAPPHLILIADDPSLALGQRNESVASFFFFR